MSEHRMDLASRVLMVRPAAFAFSEEGAGTNVFQHRSPLGPAALLARARAEVEGAAAALRAAGVDVVLVDDTAEPPKPDAVFPNNWFTAEGDGVYGLYPLALASRRPERRVELLSALPGFQRLIDLSPLEAEGAFLEGTGSVILDRARRLAFACRSARTTDAGLRVFAQAFGYEVVAFDAALGGVPVYHTNVVLALTPGAAVLATGCVTDGLERLVARLDRPVVAIDADQVRRYCGNVLALAGRDGPVLLQSRTAHDAFTPAQRARLPAPVVVEIPTIEAVGGGGARCMVAELW